MFKNSSKLIKAQNLVTKAMLSISTTKTDFCGSHTFEPSGTGHKSERGKTQLPHEVST
jgi:hypothetical protein